MAVSRITPAMTKASESTFFIRFSVFYKGILLRPFSCSGIRYSALIYKVISVTIFCDFFLRIWFLSFIFAKITICWDMSNIGQQIKERRKSLKVTQRQLAELAGIGINTLTKIERGEANPSLSILNKVLDTLGLELTTSIKRID
jgi:y4mF family transcriptional regulator